MCHSAELRGHRPESKVLSEGVNSIKVFYGPCNRIVKVFAIIYSSFLFVDQIL